MLWQGEMKYFNKDYANFVVSDEKEAQLVQEKSRIKKWRLDPELKLAYQKRYVKNGNILIASLTFLSLLYLAMAAYYYFEKPFTPILIVFLLLSIFWGIGAAIHYHEVKKARADILKSSGATGA